MAETTRALRRALRHLRLRLRARRAAARDRPRQRPGGRRRSVAEPQRRVYVRRINVAGNTRTRDEVDAARVPPVRVGLVRRPQDQAVARPGRPARLLQRSQRRDQRGARHARPGRPDDHGQGEAHRQPARSAPAISIGRQALAHRLDQAGERLRLGQLPRHRGQHQQVQPHAGASARSTRTSRSTASRARSTSTTAPASPINSQGEEYKLVTPGASVRFGVPFSEFDTVFFGIGVEQHRDHAARHAAEQLLRSTASEFGETSTSLPLTIGWSRDSRDSALVPTAGRYQRVNVDWGAARRRAATCAPTCSTSSTSRSRSASPSASTPRSATARAWAAGPTRSSRTSTAAAWARCAASTRARSARST